MRLLSGLGCRGLSMVLLFSVSACGGSSAKPPEAPLISVEQDRATAEVPPASLPEVPTTLERADVDQVVDAGLGRFLQSVSVEPSLVEGRFQGFRIVEIRPPDAFHGVDLKVGDVVTRINDMPIERPQQAYDAFVSLKQANALVVSFIRGGKPRELTLPIVGAPSEPPAATAPASAQGAAKAPAPAAKAPAPKR